MALDGQFGNPTRAFAGGWAEDGRCGIGRTTATEMKQTNFPFEVCEFGGGNTSLLRCAAGQGHSLFLSLSGSLWACGTGSDGELGTSPVLDGCTESFGMDSPSTSLPKIAPRSAIARATVKTVHQPINILFGDGTIVKSIAAGDRTSS